MEGISSQNQPLCFVLMPFGSKPDPSGGPDIDFNRIYNDAIKPGIEAADMYPVRADEEKLGGIIHKAMFERLLICEYAVADLTTSNPNVMYELGIRHAARPRTTLTIYAASSPLPFDVKPLRTQPYQLGAENEFPESSAAELQQRVTEHLMELKSLPARQAIIDSPLFQLITGWKPEPLSPDSADGFSQEKVKASEELKSRLRRIGRAGADVTQRPMLLERLAQIHADVFSAGNAVDVGVMCELMLSLPRTRRLVGHDQSCRGDARIPPKNRFRFASSSRSPTTGVLKPHTRPTTVRMHWTFSRTWRRTGLHPRDLRHDRPDLQEPVAGGIQGSRRGQIPAVSCQGGRRVCTVASKADWREIYPGVNAVTLLEVQGDKDALALKERLLPVVRFAAEQTVRGPRPNYWDHATMLELAVLAGDAAMANKVMDDVLATYSETWQPQTTAGKSAHHSQHSRPQRR